MRCIRALVAVAVGAACAEAGTQVHVDTAPDFSAAHGGTVSIFGVFHDGRMSEEAWTSLAPKVSAMLGGTACSVGYGAGLREARPELAKWAEDSTRENGITDELLERVAPSARGDFVMVLMVYRHIPQSRSRDAGGARPAAPMLGRRGRFGGGVQARGMREEESDSRVFELSASLYSVHAKHLVAEIDLRYGGDDLDEAMSAFSEKVHAVVPNGTCVGWQWPALSIDDAGDDR